MDELPSDHLQRHQVPPCPLVKLVPQSANSLRFTVPQGDLSLCSSSGGGNRPRLRRVFLTRTGKPKRKRTLTGETDGRGSDQEGIDLTCRDPS